MKENNLQFVDAHILVYAHDRNAREKRERAISLVTTLWEKRQGVISLQILSEFFVTVTQKIQPSTSLDSVKAVMQHLSCWYVVEPNRQSIVSAMEILERHSLSYWDAMVLQSAKQANVQILWTENLSHGQTIEGIQIQNPFIT